MDPNFTFASNGDRGGGKARKLFGPRGANSLAFFRLEILTSCEANEAPRHDVHLTQDGQRVQRTRIQDSSGGRIARRESMLDLPLTIERRALHDFLAFHRSPIAVTSKSVLA